VGGGAGGLIKLEIKVCGIEIDDSVTKTTTKLLEETPDVRNWWLGGGGDTNLRLRIWLRSVENL
jgi:hypothetical protein